MVNVNVPCQDEDGKEVRFSFSTKDVIDHRNGPNNSADDLKEVYRGSFTTDTGKYFVAVKEYKIKKADLHCVSVERAKENLKFLSLPGNEHPHFIRFWVHHETWEENDSEEEEDEEEVREDSEGDNELEKGNSSLKLHYLVMELCICSVADLISKNRKKKYPNWNTICPRMPMDIEASDILQRLPHKEILRQSADAVNFLHGLGIIHRNLHPDNFLIHPDMKVKLTDFDLAKDWEHFFKVSKYFPWSDWRYFPECVELQNSSFEKEEVTASGSTAEQDNKTDVFTLGCYFYYVLSEGSHPFGDTGDAIKKTIGDKNSKVYLDPPGATDQMLKIVPDETERNNALKLIQSMIRFNSSDRKSLWEVLQDTYFTPSQLQYDIYDYHQSSNEVSSTRTGLCVIVCQEEFESLDNLTGMRKDAAQLRRTFARFGYDVLLYENLRSEQLVSQLDPSNLADKFNNKLDNKEKLSDYASLVVCILTHGDKGVVCGIDASTDYVADSSVVNDGRPFFQRVVIGEVIGVIENGDVNAEIDGVVKVDIDGNVNGLMNGYLNGDLEGYIENQVNGYIKGDIASNFHFKGRVDGVENINRKYDNEAITCNFEGVITGELKGYANIGVNCFFRGKISKGSFHGEVNGKMDCCNVNGTFNCVVNGNVKGVKNGLIKNGRVSINHLRNIFHSERCPGLAGKPKVFVIFACQGASDQVVNKIPPQDHKHSTDVEMIDGDQPGSAALVAVPATELNYTRNVTADESSSKGSPPIADFLFLVSTVEDFKSYYIKGVGSPFIAYLCGAMTSEYGDNHANTAEEEKGKKDLAHLFTLVVVPRVSQWAIKVTGHPEHVSLRNTPELRSSLNKTIRFRAKQSTFEIANKIKKACIDSKNKGNLSSEPTKFEYSKDQ